MPTFEITAPDGKKYRVEGASAEGALAAVKKMAPSPANAAPASPSVGSVGDIARAAGSGLVSGALAVPGIVGDIDMLARSGGIWLGNKARALAGKPPVDPETMRGRFLEGIAPTSQEIKEYVGFNPYEPQTTAGKYVGTAAEFLPMAVTGGAGAIARAGIKGGTMLAAKEAARVGGKYGAVPAVASEAAGQATEGTGLETPARLAGSVLGAGGLGALEATMATRRAIKAAPTSAALGSQAGKLYGRAERMGIGINPGSFAKAIDNLTAKLRQAGANAKQQPKSVETIRILNRARDATANGAKVELKDMETLRQIAGNVLKDIDPNERRVTHMIVDSLDDFMESLKPADIVGGNAARAGEAIGIIKKARQLWKYKSKTEIIERLFEKAHNQVGKNYTQAGFQTALRQKFGALANNHNAFRRFSKDEQEAILKVVRGGPLENALRKIGKFAPTGYLTMGGAVGAGYMLGAGPAAALATGALTARQSAQSIAKRNAEIVKIMTATGGRVPREATRSRLGAMAGKGLLYGGRPLLPGTDRNTP